MWVGDGGIGLARAGARRPGKWLSAGWRLAEAPGVEGVGACICICIYRVCVGLARSVAVCVESCFAVGCVFCYARHMWGGMVLVHM